MINWKGHLKSIRGLSGKSFNFEVSLPDQESVLSMIPDIMIQTDKKWRITWTNQPGFAFFGEEIIGKDFNSLSVEKLDLSNILQPIISGEEEFTFLENWQRRKDGNKRLLSWKIRRLMNKAGKIVGVLSLARDITGEKNNEFNLLERTIEIESFFAYSLELLCIADIKGNFIKLSQQWETVLGYPLKELIGHKFIDFVHPEDVPATLEMSSAGSKQKKITCFRNRYRHKDGSYRWIEWSSFSIGQAVYASARDITEQLSNQEAIRTSEARYRNLVQNSPIVNYHIDKNGIFLLSEGKGLAGLGLLPGQIVGQSIYEVYKDRPEILASFELALTGKQTQFNTSVNGRFYESFMEPVEDSDHKINSVVGVAVDLTESNHAKSNSKSI